MNTPELLAPAGSKESLQAAVKGGADAVYLGGTLFNARIFAKNFDGDALKEAVDYCHAHRVFLYVTVNTQLYDRELGQAMEYVRFLYEIGVDAIICADLGLASLIHRQFPDFPLHASTQLSGHNTACAKRLQSLGFCRMVCAREMHKEDIATLCRRSPIEIEQFVHGALCASHSGQCLMSAMIGGRSGNRGACAQPCRMAYQNGNFALSLKDLCLASHITDILRSGVASLKLEGRMKSPDYVYGVTALYRRLIDERRNATPKELADLAKLFCRGGFTDGYYTGKTDASMLGVRSQKDKAASQTVRQSFVPVKRQNPLPFSPPVRTHIADTVSLPKRVSALPKATASARFLRAEQIPKTHSFDIVYLPLFSRDWQNPSVRANGAVLPSVIYDRDTDAVAAALAALKARGVSHILCGNLGHLDLVRDAGMTLHADFRCNICNQASADVWVDAGAVDFILSPELILAQMRDIGREKCAIVYGKLPLMLLEKRVGERTLRDRTGASFAILPEGKRDVLYNSVPIYMADAESQLQSAHLCNRHFLFSDESPAQVQSILRAYATGARATSPHRRILQKPQGAKPTAKK